MLLLQAPKMIISTKHETISEQKLSPANMMNNRQYTKYKLFHNFGQALLEFDNCPLDDSSHVIMFGPFIELYGGCNNHSEA